MSESTRFWNISRKADGNGELQIDGVLMTEESWWGDDGVVIARDIRKQLSELKDVTVWINSPGGDVMAGAEIYTALRNHSDAGLGKVTVKISGIAASAASVVAMAGDEIYMSPVAYMMIHNPWTYVQGNAKDLEHEVEVLKTITEGLINAYQIRTGKDRDEIIAMLDAETYMSAAECVAQGFADGILWEDLKTSDPNASTVRAARMTARAYGAQQICAMIRDHEKAEEPEAPEEAAPANEAEEQPEPAPEEAKEGGGEQEAPAEENEAEHVDDSEAEWRETVAMRAAALRSALEYILPMEG